MGNTNSNNVEDFLNMFSPEDTPASPVASPRRNKLKDTFYSPIKRLRSPLSPRSPRVKKEKAVVVDFGDFGKEDIEPTPAMKSPTHPKSPVQHNRFTTQLRPSPPASPQLNRWRKVEEPASNPAPAHAPSFTITEKVLGEGAFSKVRLATNDRTGQKVAVKSFAIPASGVMSREQSEDLAMIKKERAILQKLNNSPHPNIITLHHSTEDDTGISLYMQLVEGGDAYGWLCERGKVSEEIARPLFKQMVDAVAHCHQLGICHRDVKLENFLLDRKTMKPVMIDFGFATPITADGYFRDFPGSPAYACPHILLGRRYKGVPADVYALGVVLYTMLYYRYPFYSENRQAMVKMICENEPTFDANARVSSEAIDLMKWMLKKNCDERPTLRQIYEHPFFSKC